MELDTLIAVITEHWPVRYQRGRVQQLYRTHENPDGSLVRVSVTIQEIQPTPLGFEIAGATLE